MISGSAPSQLVRQIMPPGPPAVPLLGKRGTKLLFYRDPIAYHSRVYQTYGTLASFMQGSTKLLVYGPEYNRHVLNQPDVFHADQIAVPGPVDSALHRLGSGLNGINGEAHRKQRRLMLPAFHRQHLEQYRDTIVGITQRLLDRWPIGQAIDIAHAMEQLTLCIVSAALFGLDATQHLDSLGHLLARWIDLNANRGVYLFPFDYPGTPFRQLLRLSERLEGYIRSLILDKRAKPSDQRDVLALLVHAQDEDGAQLSEAEVIGNATLLFCAGFETSAVALTWTLFLLAQHPEIMADLLDELDAVLHGDAPTVAQMRELPLLDRVIKETLRLFPPAIHGGRIAVQPFSMGGYDFPVGTKVMYSEYITHRIPDQYPAPQRFNPERWQGLEPSPFAYIPFLAGPHRCLGAEFAMLELKIVLPLVLQRYRVSLMPDIRVDRAVLLTLAPKEALPMLVAPQDRQFTKVRVRGNIHEMVDLDAAC